MLLWINTAWTTIVFKLHLLSNSAEYVDSERKFYTFPTANSFLFRIRRTLRKIRISNDHSRTQTSLTTLASIWNSSKFSRIKRTWNSNSRCETGRDKHGRTPRGAHKADGRKKDESFRWFRPKSEGLPAENFARNWLRKGWNFEFKSD